ncbi:hypothetical protein CLU95_5556 [Variovorax sp. 54]|uniref:hypothetical protein n=1 Tax=Variovorax sp. 54 TaxID=2035212 RepID=UPI000C19F9B9|nr:hypothetical protein [Variovorax sp. 54]PIF78370.1 hypothetical protein CLU95_5556 [Variovorax sp. 54]
MPMDFLERIEDASFPMAVRDEADIHCATMLVAAHLIEAVLPPAASGTGGRVAVLLLITPKGRAALRLRRDELQT